MNLHSRRVFCGALASTALAAATRPAGAVIILDSTWRAEGGRPGRESDGFRAHIALANQPQFAALVALAYVLDEEEWGPWGAASGTWIANSGGAGYVLTAAHVFDPGESAGAYVYCTADGTVRHGTGVVFHPLYQWHQGDSDRTGYDFAVVRLDGPVINVGPPPFLYAGDQEEGARVVMVGYGSRGIGSVGEQPVYESSSFGKAAAENTVDEMMEAVHPVPHDESAGNWLRVTLKHESEGASRLDGLLGTGDSGGSTWLRTRGVWAIAGVNATGSYGNHDTPDTPHPASSGCVEGNSCYGEHSFFARVSGVRDWLARVVPGARFIA